MNGSGLRRFRRVGGLALIAAAPVAVVAEVLHPQFHPTDASQQVAAVAAGSGRHFASHVLVLALLALALPAFAALLQLLRPHRPRLATAALAAFVPGVVALAAVVGMEFVLWQMAQPARDQAEMVALMTAVNESGGNVALVLVAILFPIAWLLAGIGLYVARALPRWSAALIGIALPVAFAVELGGMPKLATIGANVAYAIGLAAAGVVVLRRSDAEWEGAAAPPVAAPSPAPAT
jgi:hypothetical protein